MPNRVLRDELMTSERWWSVSPEARSLWISVFLSADDLGRCPGTPFVVRTKYLAGTASAERAENLVTELMDVDLLRVYDVEGARFFFVPRFRQYVRYKRSRYPEPPPGVDDCPEVHSAETSEINDVVENKQCLSSAQAVPKQRLSIAQATLAHPEVKRREEKEYIARQRSYSRKHPAPADFSLSPRVLHWAEQQGVLNLQAHFDNFMGVARAKGYQYADWDQALMNAVRNDWARIGDGKRKVAL